MADQPKTKSTKKASGSEKDGVLKATAKAIGKAAGKIASLAGAEAEVAPPVQPRTKSVKPAKLAKKNNPHLPRKLKKAQKKAAEAKSAV